VGTFAVGQVIVFPFPFSNLERNKFRPALLLASVGRGDWLVCQITSNAYSDKRAIEINNKDFVSGSLQRVSYVRSGKLFTAHEIIFSGFAGQLSTEKFLEIREAVIMLLRKGSDGE
jgi:mRNA interferase MazF